MRRQSLAFGAAALVIALGLGLKSQRYAGQFEDRQADDMARIAAVAASEGWTLVESAGGTLPFVHATFVKPGCANHLRVAPLGSSRELVAEVELAFGPDVMFVETDPASRSRGFSLSGWFAPGLKPLGRIAVSPAPVEHQSACGPPAAGRWLGA